eukprot:201598-Chlamydomonas_euryale.AAC.1
MQTLPHALYPSHTLIRHTPGHTEECRPSLTPCPPPTLTHPHRLGSCARPFRTAPPHPLPPHLPPHTDVRLSLTISTGAATSPPGNDQDCMSPRMSRSEGVAAAATAAGTLAPKPFPERFGAVAAVRAAAAAAGPAPPVLSYFHLCVLRAWLCSGAYRV